MSESDKPKRGDAEWTDFILEQLRDDEKFDNIPRMEGLKRMVEEFISPIVGISVEMIPTQSTYMTVMAKASVHLENGQFYEACSDANMWNTTDAFRGKLTPIADTRAKSKAFREILGLQNTSSLEEVGNSHDPETDEFISRPQILAINNHCKELKIEVETAMNHFLADPPRTFEKMKTGQAIELMEKLNDIKHGRADMPAELQGEVHDS